MSRSYFTFLAFTIIVSAMADGNGTDKGVDTRNISVFANSTNGLDGGLGPIQFEIKDYTGQEILDKVQQFILNDTYDKYVNIQELVAKTKPDEKGSEIKSKHFLHILTRKYTAAQMAKFNYFYVRY
ncbi:hypothetical protein DdX_16930 [Ditylenchus destructor]|uniref:Uncharacterized protein n=1 Tax=Ditylenchus destructor TaxID=166010 RepID=A0AAD4MPF5_9BILA|nr:hypothetical protein DdX_16930 [Ditylenchus destructor]